MRQIILTAILFSVATPALAQTNESEISTPDPKPVVSAASHAQITPPTSDKLTAVQEEAARILRFQRAMSATSQVAPNGIKPMELYQAPAQPAARAVPSPTPTAGTLHTVAKGDTLYSLSKRYNLTITDLKQANGIQGNGIKLGQSLKIPAVAVQTVLPTKVASISKPDFNGPVTRKIVEPVPSDAETQMATDPLSSTVQIYAVLPKDTLSSISRRTCVSMKELVSTNELANPDALKPGQRLELPVGHCLKN